MAEMKFTLLMPGTPEGSVMGTRYTCDGDNVSPQTRMVSCPERNEEFRPDR